MLLGTNLPAWIRYSLIFSLLWILLSQGDPGSWVIGIIIVPLASWCAIKLFPPQVNSQSQHLVASELFKFIPFFIGQSLKGGWESALLAIHPQRRFCPGFIAYRTKLPPGRPRLFFTNTIGLMPGTMSVEWRGDNATIHTLDNRIDHGKSLRQCETKIAALFDLKLTNNLSESKLTGMEKK